MPAPDLGGALVADGLLELRGGALRTTRRLQAAMARAAYRLLQDEGDERYDLRAAIASALFELCDSAISDEEVAAYVAVLLPIQERELDPRGYVTG